MDSARFYRNFLSCKALIIQLHPIRVPDTLDKPIVLAFDSRHSSVLYVHSADLVRILPHPSELRVDIGILKGNEPQKESL